MAISVSLVAAAFASSFPQLTFVHKFQPVSRRPSIFAQCPGGHQNYSCALHSLGLDHLSTLWSAVSLSFVNAVWQQAGRQEIRHAYGCSALLLSGGGALGAFHLGVVKALLANSTLPKVVSGTSAGSIVAALAATHTDEELHAMYAVDMRCMTFDLFSNVHMGKLTWELVTKGAMHCHDHFKRSMRRLVGDLTFIQAHHRTGRALNIVVTSADTNEPFRVLNHVTTPDVVVWSAVAASCAMPGIYRSTDLIARDAKGQYVKFAGGAATDTKRRWRDGTLEQDMPLCALGHLFNANYFIASQTNPHIVPALKLKTFLPPRLAFQSAYRYDGQFCLMDTVVSLFHGIMGLTSCEVLEAEVKHRWAQLAALCHGFLPSVVFTVLDQPWEGDTTIVLPWRMYGWVRALFNYNPEQTCDAIRMGEQGALQQFTAIAVNCAVESYIDTCLASITGSVPPPTRAAHLHGKHFSRISASPSASAPHDCCATAVNQRDAAAASDTGARAAPALHPRDAASMRDLTDILQSDPTEILQSDTTETQRDPDLDQHSDEDESVFKYDGVPPAALPLYPSLHAAQSRGSLIGANYPPSAASPEGSECDWTETSSTVGIPTMWELVGQIFSALQSPSSDRLVAASNKSATPTCNVTQQLQNPSANSSSGKSKGTEKSQLKSFPQSGRALQQSSPSSRRPAAMKSPSSRSYMGTEHQLSLSRRQVPGGANAGGSAPGLARPHLVQSPNCSSANSECQEQMHTRFLRSGMPKHIAGWSRHCQTPNRRWPVPDETRHVRSSSDTCQGCARSRGVRSDDAEMGACSVDGVWETALERKLAPEQHLALYGARASMYLKRVPLQASLQWGERDLWRLRRCGRGGCAEKLGVDGSGESGSATLERGGCPNSSKEDDKPHVRGGEWDQPCYGGVRDSVASFEAVERQHVD